MSDCLKVSDDLHHRLDALPRLDSRLEDLVWRQQETMLTAVTQFHRVYVRDVRHTGSPVARVARRTICNVQ